MLQTNRFFILPLHINHTEQFYQLLSSNHNRIKESFPKLTSSNSSLAESKEYIEQKMLDFENKLFFSFGLWLKDTETLIGYLAIKNIDWSISKAEMGYFIDQIYEGKGMVTEALQILISYAFDELKMNKLYLRSLQNNIASQRVAEKNGFLKEGILRKEFKSGNDQLEDVIYYGLIQSDL